jgi:hypothetical protein
MADLARVEKLIAEARAKGADLWDAQVCDAAELMLEVVSERGMPVERRHQTVAEKALTDFIAEHLEVK